MDVSNTQHLGSWKCWQGGVDEGRGSGNDNVCYPFRTLAFLETSLFGLCPQRLVSNNAVLFTNNLLRSVGHRSVGPYLLQNC